MPIEFFDCNCSIGCQAVPYPGSYSLASELDGRMAEYGIGRALVYHAVARDHHPGEGNPMLIEEIREYDNLLPCWVVMPHHTGEFPKPSVMSEKLRENGVRAVRIYPSAARHNYSLSPYSAGDMLEVLEAHKIPLFVDIDEIGWDNIDAILDTYKALPVILCNTGYRSDRYIYPLMKTYENLHIETSRFLSHLGLEALVRETGSKRILFGTGMPLYTGAGAVYYINKLMLDDEAKQDIAAGNLRRLLREVGT